MQDSTEKPWKKIESLPKEPHAPKKPKDVIRKEAIGEVLATYQATQIGPKELETEGEVQIQETPPMIQYRHGVPKRRKV